MPLIRPFPFPNLSIGTDICEVYRVRKLAKGCFPNGRQKLPRFISRVLTYREQLAFRERFPDAVDFEYSPKSYREQAASLTKAEDDAGGKDRALETVARHLAGRWAAKEAIIKACTWRRLTFDQIQILKSPTGPSVYGVILDKPGAPADYRAIESESRNNHDSESGQIVKVSISHDGKYATAVCLAAEEPREGDVGGEAAARGL